MPAVRISVALLGLTMIAGYLVSLERPVSKDRWRIVISDRERYRRFVERQEAEIRAQLKKLQRTERVIDLVTPH